MRRPHYYKRLFILEAFRIAIQLLASVKGHHRDVSKFVEHGSIVVKILVILVCYCTVILSFRKNFEVMLLRVRLPDILSFIKVSVIIVVTIINTCNFYSTIYIN